ncbi:MAG: hypothetical protein ACRC1Z_03725 [Waterburya sp.]
MPIIICPGIHDPHLTELFIQALQDKIPQDYLDYLVLPTSEYLPYSAIAVFQWLDQQGLSKTSPLAFIAFSAGVVGGFGAAIAWQLKGGRVDRLIAIDGWGMPLVANFPIFRVSHDYFTHWSSGMLGSGSAGFYADPGVEHLELWRSPSTSCGWRMISPGYKTHTVLTDYLLFAFQIQL